VRERWINYLNPNLRKDLWLMREDLIILGNVLKKGKRWSYIAKKLEGRTENQVKNRYKSLINKIWSDEDIDELEAISIYVKRK
jgi:transcriptional activator Myb